LHAPSTTSPGTHDAHTLNGIDNVGGCNSVWSRFSRILNYITYEPELPSDRHAMGQPVQVLAYTGGHIPAHLHAYISNSTPFGRRWWRIRRIIVG